jgi:hypothetical protein
VIFLLRQGLEIVVLIADFHHTSSFELVVQYTVDISLLFLLKTFATLTRLRLGELQIAYTLINLQYLVVLLRAVCGE